MPLLSSSAFLILLLFFSSSAAAHGRGGGSSSNINGPDDAAADTDFGTAHDLRSRSLVLVKVWCLILVFVGTFVCGVSPYFFKWNEGFLVLGTQFAGGVFLGTALMHFLSDSNETFEHLTSKEYPFAFTLACAGYSLTMLADCLIVYVFSRRRDDVPISTYTGDLELQGTVDRVKSGRDGAAPQSIQESHGHGQEAPFAHAASLGDSILLIAALCFHSVFEGIAIGVAETQADAWRALWTVSLHKIFAAIAMGIALLRMIPNRPLLSCAAYAFAFAISSPIGVAIGIIIDATTQGVVADWIYAISMGLACGVFIYVSINHLITKGYTPLKRVVPDKPVYKFLAVLLGIAVIAVVMIWD